MLPPIDALAIEQFAAHMLQHELMTLVAAPLIVAGRPLATILWGLPARLRGVVGRGLSARKVAHVIAAASAPVVAWLVHGVVLWVWHAPRLYDAAVADESVHAVQHAMFVVSAALFWWGMLAGRYGRVGYGAAVFYVFTTVVHTGLLGAILTLSPVPLYPTYVTAAHLHGFDALMDQQLAGLLMWIPAGALLTILGLSLAAAWLGEAERRQRL
jgi:cytochrome c oxidase assembly factor CtaG